MKLDYLDDGNIISLSCINSNSTVQAIFFNNNLDLIDSITHTQFTQCESIYGHSIIKSNSFYYVISDVMCENYKRCYEPLDGNLSLIEIINQDGDCSNGEYYFSLNNSCLKTCPHNYEINNNKCIFKSFEQDTTFDEFKNQIKNNINSYFNSSEIINGTNFLAVFLTSDIIKPEEQLNKGISAIDLGNCTETLKEYYNISNEESLIILNMESKTDKSQNMENNDDRSFNLGKNTQLEIYDYEGNKLNISICKNTTIYTSEGRELQNEDTSYLSDIMPTLFTIAEKVKNIMGGYTEKFEKVYITGTGSLINNVDLYFQEYLTETTCEILRPYFVVQTKDLSIKDYIEVNSAISIALMGVGKGISGMNFKKKSVLDDLQNILKKDVGESKKGKKDHSGLLTWDLNERLDIIEKNLLRGASGLLILIIIYTAFSSLLNNQITKKQQEAENSINDTKAQISLANQDNEKIKTKLNEYTTLIKNIEEENNKQSERNKTRNAIPNLLNQIMSIVPENVQLTSIENTTGTHVVIDAQSNKYEQLGYLKAKIKTDVILTNVISTAGQKDNNTVTVRIEGDLP